ncbi:MAG: L-aspartate oxidase [Alphaproteobacteria bacterium]|nr:L-aspartate oxidase [Alphaproteobacteria bacterium]
MAARLPDNVIETGGVLIAGAGLAGLFCALQFKDRPVTVLATAKPGAGAASAWAQGGIAAPLGPDDSTALHVADTVAAGAGLVDEAIVRLMAEEAPERIDDLARLGVPFDRDAQGRLVLGREAAHSRNRIVRVQGDRAGAEIMKALGRTALARPNIRIVWGLTALELGLVDGRTAGLFARTADGRPVFLKASQIVFALGGVGALYEVTTNPAEARGQGIAIAARAGAKIADAEFVQFHPTAIAVGRDPAPLATEALRGEGAVLISEKGVRFMTAVHPLAELAPRDIVARAIHREIQAGGKAFLDARAAVGKRFPDQFPTVHAACIAEGIDPVTMPIPVAPAAHYHMGGIAVDAWGRTGVPGLWACGEVASTGAHGANRLASNSLLEAIVFGSRVARDICDQGEPDTSALAAVPEFDGPHDTFLHAPQQLRRAMTAFVGVERNAEGLFRALAEIDRVERAGSGDLALVNMTTAAKFIAAAALLRRESRGGHYRSDCPAADPSMARRRSLTLGEANAVLEEARSTPLRIAAAP